MPQLAVEVSHTLGQDEAARRLRQRFADVSASYNSQVSNLRQEWNGHSFSFGFHIMGMNIAGTVVVEPARVKLSTNLPFAAMLFKGAIESRIRQEVAEVLA